jgi:hypothetical protein
LRARFAKIGVGPGRTYDFASLDAETKASLNLVAGVEEGRKRLDARVAETKSSVDLFGTRNFLGEDFAMRRAVGAALGI